MAPTPPLVQKPHLIGWLAQIPDHPIRSVHKPVPLRLKDWSCLMKSHLGLAFGLSIVVCSQMLAQSELDSLDEASQNSSSSSSTVALVYVSRTLKGGSTNEIEAFRAAPDGKLAPVDGSPFEENVTSMAANGKYLFAANSNKIDIDSYKIESDGALHYASTTSISKSSDDCGTLGPLFFDRTGTSLYDMEIDGSGCANNTYELFAVHESTGALKTMGNDTANGWLDLPAAFIGNNVYAYSASCVQDMYWGIFGFRRSKDGVLGEININGAPPSPPDGYFYCPSQAAADKTDHVAMTMQPVNQYDFTANKPVQLATYTADSKGNLTTKSTAENMPKASIGSVKDLVMSPSGKLLAVGGTSGLEVFHFNGSEPIQHFTGRLTKDEIDQFAWDNENHLYAISHTAGKLFVFTITPTSYKEASGSPYSIDAPLDIVVQPK